MNQPSKGATITSHKEGRVYKLNKAEITTGRDHHSNPVGCPLWFCCATKLGFSEDIGAKEVFLLLLGVCSIDGAAKT